MRRFNLLCSIIGLAFLLLSQGAKWVQYERRGLPQTQDFDQYYMGGVIARHGAWADLYPIPKPGAQTNPGEAENSDLRARYAELARQYGVSELGTRYMQPPPTAILFIPLTFLPVKAAHALWIVVLCVATWGIAHQSARAYTLCSGRRDFVVGLLILFVCLSLQAHRWIRVGNMSAIVGWLIGFVGLSIAEFVQGARPAVAMVIGAAAKYVTLVFVPLHIAARQWKTLAWTAAIGVASLLISIGLTGIQPYRVFLGEIAPTLGRTVLRDANVSLEACLLRALHAESLAGAPRIAFQVTRVGLLAMVLYGLFRRSRADWQKPPRALAAATALTAWLLIFSPILWEHYVSHLAPFWGWMVWEALGARERARLWLRPVVIGALVLAWFPQKVIDGRHLPEPINSFLLWSTALTLAVAVYRMFKSGSATADSSAAGAAGPPAADASGASR